MKWHQYVALEILSISFKGENNSTVKAENYSGVLKETIKISDLKKKKNF